MSESPYSKFDENKLILRDELAIDRTVLANERTMLSYLRSGVALGIAGVSIMHFANEGWFWGFGMVCIPVGMVIGIVGVIRYRKMEKAICAVRKKCCKEAG